MNAMIDPIHRHIKAFVVLFFQKALTSVARTARPTPLFLPFRRGQKPEQEERRTKKGFFAIVSQSPRHHVCVSSQQSEFYVPKSVNRGRSQLHDTARTT